MGRRGFWFSGQPALTWILRKLLSEVGDVFMGGRPVRLARITVEYQRAGFQPFFEFFMAECNCLVVVVRTNDFEINAVAHESPADRAIRCLRLLEQFLSIPDGSACRFLTTLPHCRS